MADDNLYDMLKSALSDFKASVDKEVKDLHKCKDQVAQLKTLLSEEVRSGQFIRDDNRIVISAPTVIIGNVDKDGQLLGGGTVVVRGSGINIEAAGQSGHVSTRATHVSTLAVDPGTDGNENVVYSGSSIVNKARSLNLESEAASGTFVSLGSSGGSGVRILSDTSVCIDAKVGSETLIKQIDAVSKSQQSVVDSINKNIDKQKKQTEDLLKSIKDILKKQDGLGDDDIKTRTNMCEILDSINELKRTLPQLYQAVSVYTSLISQLGEAKRQIKDLKAAKDSANKKKGDYKKKNTGCGLYVSAENLGYSCVDGDANVRDTETSGVVVSAANMTVNSRKADGTLIDKGKYSINVQNMTLSTADNKVKDAKNRENPAVGDFRLISKNINVESVDYETKDSKEQEKALTQKGTMSVRVENFKLSATDTEGKATGLVSLNGKKVEVKSMDVDKEKRTDKQLAQGSTALFVSEKMYHGGSDSKNKSKLYQVSSEQVGLFAKTTAEIQQDKGILQLSGGNASLAGGKTDVYGDLTVMASTTFKDQIKAPKGSIDNLEAKTSFKSANISDGMGVAAPAAKSSLSAKLKEEDAPKSDK